MPILALNIILRFAGWPLVGVGLFAWQLGLSEGPIFLGAGVGAVLRAVVMKRRENTWTLFKIYFVFGMISIIIGLNLLGWDIKL